MKKIINKYLLLFLCIFSLVLPTGCEVKEQKQVVVDYQEYHFRNEDLLESHYEKHGKEMGFSSSKEYEMSASDVVNNPESLHKTEKEDGDDVSEEIKVYESARTKQLDSYKEVLENEILAMNKMGQ